MRRLNCFAALSSLDYSPSNAARPPFFSVLKNYPRNFYFRKTTEQLCRSFAARYVHAHVERRFVRETEPTSQRVQLQRRNPEIGNNTAYLPDFRCREAPRKFTKISMHRAEARAVLR